MQIQKNPEVRSHFRIKTFGSKQPVTISLYNHLSPKHYKDNESYSHLGQI